MHELQAGGRGRRWAGGMEHQDKGWGTKVSGCQKKH